MSSSTPLSREEILQLGQPSAEFQKVLEQIPALSYIDIPYSKETINGLRAQVAASTTKTSPAPEGVIERDTQIPARDGAKIPIRIHSPKTHDPSTTPLIVNYHGGGWIMGDLETSTDMCRSLVRDFGAVVVNVDYRLAPEYPFPVPVNDCWDALKWSAENYPELKCNHHRGFLVAGVSAGANLAAIVAIQARDKNLSPPLTGQFLSALPAFARENVHPRFKSAWLSYEQNKAAPILNRPLYDFIMDCYAPDHRSDEFAPILSEVGFEKLPPAYFAICGMDPLRDDGILYEQALREEGGVATKKNIYPGVPHCWWSMLPQLEASAQYEKDSAGAFKWLLKL